MKTRMLWWFVVALLTLGLVGQYVAYRSEGGKTMAHATWRLTPNNFSDVVKAADTVVEAQVVSVEAGAPIVVPVPNEPGGQDSIPTERVTVNVTSSDKGSAQTGQQLVIFQTGGQRAVNQPKGGGQPDEGRNQARRLNPPSGGKAGNNPESQAPQVSPRTDIQAAAAPDSGGTHIYLIPESPPYEVGATYFLALEDGPAGTKRPVHPAGRYKVVGGNRLQATGDDPVSQSVNGLDVARAKAAARGQENIPTSAPGLQRRETTEEGLPGMPTTGQAHSGDDVTQPMIFLWIGLALVVVGAGFGIVSFARSKRENARKL